MPATVRRLRPEQSEPELEALLLGALLASPEQARWLACAGLEAEDIASPRVRRCWALVEERARAGMQTNGMELWAAALPSNALAVEDEAWAMGLEARSAIVTQGQWMLTVKALRDLRHARELKRRLGEEAEAIAATGVDRDRLFDFERERQRLLASVAEKSAEADVLLEKFFRGWGEREAPEVMATGIPVLDEAIGGGWVRGLNVLVADPGTGKSGLMASVLASQLEAGHRPGLFNLEDKITWLWMRLFARELNLTIGQVKREAPPEGAWRAELKLKKLLEPLQLDATPHITSKRVARLLSQWAQEGVTSVYLDHVGRLDHEVGERGNNWAVADTYNRLCEAALSAGVALVVLAHRSSAVVRAERKPAPPKASDIGLTAAAHQSARLVVGLWRRDPKDGELRIHVAKHNEGEVGADVWLPFLPCAMVDPAGGGKLDLEAERQADLKVQQDARAKAQVHLAAARARLRAEAKKQAELFPEEPSDA